MSFLVAVQEAIDIAFHVVTDEAWGVPGSYADAFPVWEPVQGRRGARRADRGAGAGLRR